MFNSPWLFFKIVEATLLLECFYIAITATQLIPLVISSNHSGGWIVGFLLPVVFNLLMLQMILDKAVLLRSVHRLEKETVSKICEDDTEERAAISYLRTAVLNILKEDRVPEKFWRDSLHYYFFRYDVKKRGLIGKETFRRILNDLGIFMSLDSLILLWRAVDFDLSGELNWAEIEDLFFPKEHHKKYEDNSDDIPAIKELRNALRSMLASYNVPVCDWENYLHNFFDELDSDHSKELNIEQFDAMLKSMDITLSSDLLRKAFETVDFDGDGTISYNELFYIIFPSSSA